MIKWIRGWDHSFYKKKIQKSKKKVKYKTAAF
jgi:hypothetical protein